MNASQVLEHLVGIPSLTGSEQDAVAWLVEQARRDGLEASTDAVGNAVITAGSGLHVLFVGHIDTVAPHLPVRREGGVLWGRGTVDAKGCLAAAYEALKRLPDGIRMTFVAAVGEESDSRGTLGLQVERPDVIVNGEPSGWSGITVGYKGIVRGRFEATGTPHHGGHPEPNVLDRVVAWWSGVCRELEAGTGFEAVQAHLDRLEHRRDVVDRAEGRFQVRLPPGTTTSHVQDVLEACAEGVDVHVEEALEAAISDPRSSLAAAFRTGIRAAGSTPRILHKTGTSDFNHLAVRFPGVPIIAYGPGDSSLDHTPEERLELAELEQGVRVWQAALEQLACHAVRCADA